ncbi:MAG: Gfo/Idh/MocA family oxidoreductase [Spirochaetota bacterium]
MGDIIRWGVLGTGKIAKKFARDLALVKNATCAAVGSRSQESADAFAREFAFARAHGSYAALAGDAAVDAVYIATPHTLHAENTIMMLNAGKAVLCEKPFAVNSAEAVRMCAAAKKKKCFLMEAMWSRFMPALIKAKALIDDGAIGEVRMLSADFGYRSKFAPEERHFNPALAGGALLDVGIYPVWLSHFLLGAPKKIAAMGHRGTTHVDEMNAMLFTHGSGAISVLHSAIRAVTIHEAFISGTNAELRLHAPWWRTSALSLLNDGKVLETWELPPVGIGYSHEIEHVNECLRSGKTESDMHSLADTRAVAKTLDRVRTLLGVRYPADGKKPYILKRARATDE